MGEVLHFADVHRAFGDHQVLRGLSVDLPLDGVTFVVGKSGGGKSVLCRIGVGLLKPDSGEVTLLGERVDQAPERRLNELRARVPYVVQGHALLDWMTLEENVALASAPDAPTVDEVIERIGLSAFRTRKPPEVGPGLRKRAAIARALRLKPRAMILDEPTTGLDRQAADLVNATIAQVAALGVGVIAVSHDYRALEAIAQRVVEVREGVVGYVGAPGPFLQREAHDG
jgi:phospholipid/cholesterol/gamma-HCH transport system ATP-binding protein